MNYSLLLLNGASEDKTVFNVPAVLQIQGEPSVEALGHSLRTVVDRHSILRTAFHTDGDSIVQNILPEGRSQLKFHDFSTDDSTPDDVTDFISRTIRQPLYIEYGHVGEYVLVRLEEKKYLLITVLHQICCDAPSLYTLMDTWMSLYEAIITDRDTATVPSPRYTYTDFTVWHNEQLKLTEALSNKSYWSSHLGSMRETHKPLPFAKEDRSAALAAARHALQ